MNRDGDAAAQATTPAWRGTEGQVIGKPAGKQCGPGAEGSAGAPERPPLRASRRAVGCPGCGPLSPETYEGKGGVPRNDVQAASGAVSGLPSVSAARMAVTGRQKS